MGREKPDFSGVLDDIPPMQSLHTVAQICGFTGDVASLRVAAVLNQSWGKLAFQVIIPRILNLAWSLYAKCQDPVPHLRSSSPSISSRAIKKTQHVIRAGNMLMLQSVSQFFIVCKITVDFKEILS